MIKEGDIIIRWNASVKSMMLYQRYKKDSSIIICPCKIKPGKRLIVKSIIGTEVLVQIENEPVISVFYISDLKGDNVGRDQD